MTFHLPLRDGYPPNVGDLKKDLDGNPFTIRKPHLFGTGIGVGVTRSVHTVSPFNSVSLLIQLRPPFLTQLIRLSILFVLLVGYDGNWRTQGFKPLSSTVKGDLVSRTRVAGTGSRHSLKSTII